MPSGPAPGWPGQGWQPAPSGPAPGWPGPPGAPGWPAPGPPPPRRTRSGDRGLAFFFLLPALLAWLWSYLIPTIHTIVRSFQAGVIWGMWDGWIGTENYAAVAADGFWGDCGYALTLAVIPLVAAFVVAPLLALAARHSGRKARLVTRGLLAAPIVAYAPTAITIAWMYDRTDSSASPEQTVLSITGWSTFGLAVAVATTFYLAANSERRSTRTTLTIAGVLTLGILAIALQSFVASYGVSVADGDIQTPMADILKNFYRDTDMGQVSAVSALLLLILAPLGIIATILLLTAHTRIEFNRETDKPIAGGIRRSPVNPLALTILVILLIALVATIGYGLYPWLNSSSHTEIHNRVSGAVFVDGQPWWKTLLYTWVPPLISGLIGVVVAAAAGFAIGALRPLGRRSEYLLLLFAPWLFVEIGPLSTAGLDRAAMIENALNIYYPNSLLSFTNLIPPSWICIPALFAFTLFFRGQHHQATATGDQNWKPSTSIAPALPMVSIAVLLSWIINAQDFLWSVVSRSDVFSAPYYAWLRNRVTGGKSETMGLVFPVPLLMLFVVVFVVLQVFYGDRLTLRTGRAESEARPLTAPATAGLGGPGYQIPMTGTTAPPPAWHAAPPTAPW